MKKSEATGRHRPSSCFKKYMDFFDWWMNPEDPLEQHEDQDDDKYKEEAFEEYDFSSDPDKAIIPQRITCVFSSSLRSDPSTMRINSPLSEASFS